MRTLQVMRSVGAKAAELTLYEVANEFDPDFATLKASDKVAGYPIRRQVILTASKSRPLLDSLTNRSTYFPPGQIWTCLFEPHHVLVIKAGGEQITFVICIKCGDIEHVLGTDSIGTHSVTPAGNREIATMLESLLPE